MHPAPNRRAAHAVARLLAIGAAILVPGIGHGQTAPAAASPWQSIEYAQVRVIAAQDRVGTGGQLDLALHIRLDPGWHTYWRAAGGVGFPPRIEWSGSQNLADLEVTWPAPHRIFTFGYEAVGYENEIVFPMHASLARADAPLGVRLDILIAVCRDICIPFEATLALDLPTGAPSTTPYARLIDRYAARIPARQEVPGFAIESVRLVDRGSGAAIEIAARADPPFEGPDLFVETRPGTILGERRTKSAGDGRFEVSVDFDLGSAEPLVAEPVTVTLVDRTRAIERALVVDPPP